MEFFPMIKKVKYEGTKTENIFAYRHYNPEEVVLGKTMKEQISIYSYKE